MSKKFILICALAMFVVGLCSGLLIAASFAQAKSPVSKIILNNARVEITEVTNDPAARREPYTRPTDQIIVFLDPADYETTDAEGKKIRKHRASGEIIWHNKGEAAPLLINQGNQPYRNLVIALK